MKAADALEEAIRSVPLPGAPPRLSLDGAAVGLSFLDTALRLNHVRRLTDRLTLLEHRAATRTTEVDVSLSLLDQGQRDASQLFHDLRSRAASIYGHTGEGAPNVDADIPSSIWVPVTRISRRSVAPIDVYDAAGSRLPRLTQFETSRLLSSGLYTLLRGVLESQARPDEDSDLNRLLFHNHESRWLIQYAMLTLIGDRNRPQETVLHATTDGTTPGYAAQHRAFVLRTMRALRDKLTDYYSLLDLAINDYLLVVALPSSHEEHLLRYDAPLHVGESRSNRASLRNAVRANMHGYAVEYRAQISANLRSYHLVVETEFGVDIDPLFVTTNADARLVDRMSNDLHTLAVACNEADPSPKPSTKLLELHMQATLRRLADLLRRRRWDASRAGLTLPQDGLMACEKLSIAAISGEAKPGPVPNSTRNSILLHPFVNPDNLRAAASEINENELAIDLSLENDPTSNRAHAYWRRHSDAARRLDNSQIEVRSGFKLRDTTGSGPRSVALYAIAVSAICGLTLCFSTRSFLPFNMESARMLEKASSADAVVVVLLLVPGFLYSLLALPSRYTISGRLRELPRQVARTSISVAAILAAAVATSAPGELQLIAYALAIVLPLAGGLLLQVRRGTEPMQINLRRLGAPEWSATNGQRRKSIRPDVRFYSSNVENGSEEGR